MVSWQRMVAIAFEVADSKGAQFEGIDQGGAFLDDLSTVWQQDKEKIKQMTEAQAREYLEDLVEA